MDSITQIALGASIGEATLGRQVGRKAWMWGAFCGLFPDLDIFFPFADAVKRFTYHRGPSHSLFVLATLTPLFVWLILKIHPQTALFKKRWYGLVYLAFATHVLLDCLTVYGTQIFWPLSTPPVMWSTIFIIDPAYSAPLFLGVLAALIVSRKKSWGHTANTACLLLSTLYLLWSVGAKVYVTNLAHESMRQQNIPYQKLLTVPAPFNTMLWRVLAIEKKGYYEGFYSLLDRTRAIQMTFYPSDKTLLAGLSNHWPVKRLQWFTHGFYAVKRLKDDIVMTDLRMGMEPFYVFQFKVGTAKNPHTKPTKIERVTDQRRLDILRWIWHRIWTDSPEMASS